MDNVMTSDDSNQIFDAVSQYYPEISRDNQERNLVVQSKVITDRYDAYTGVAGKCYVFVRQKLQERILEIMSKAPKKPSSEWKYKATNSLLYYKVRDCDVAIGNKHVEDKRAGMLQIYRNPLVLQGSYSRPQEDFSGVVVFEAYNYEESTREMIWKLSSVFVENFISNSPSYTKFFLSVERMLKRDYSKILYAKMMDASNIAKGYFDMTMDEIRRILGYDRYNCEKKVFERRKKISDRNLISKVFLPAIGELNTIRQDMCDYFLEMQDMSSTLPPDGKRGQKPKWKLVRFWIRSKGGSCQTANEYADAEEIKDDPADAQEEPTISVEDEQIIKQIETKLKDLCSIKGWNASYYPGRAVSAIRERTTNILQPEKDLPGKILADIVQMEGEYDGGDNEKDRLHLACHIRKQLNITYGLEPRKSKKKVSDVDEAKEVKKLPVRDIQEMILNEGIEGYLERYKFLDEFSFKEELEKFTQEIILNYSTESTPKEFTRRFISKLNTEERSNNHNNRYQNGGNIKKGVLERWKIFMEELCRAAGPDNQKILSQMIYSNYDEKTRKLLIRIPSEDVRQTILKKHKEITTRYLKKHFGEGLNIVFVYNKSTEE